jgi:hypothetical protein
MSSEREQAPRCELLAGSLGEPERGRCQNAAAWLHAVPHHPPIAACEAHRRLWGALPGEWTPLGRPEPPPAT